MGTLDDWVRSRAKDTQPKTMTPVDQRAALIESGIPEGDVDAYRALLGEHWAPAIAPGGAASLLLWDLETLHQEWPTMTLRSALGWSLVGAFTFGVEPYALEALVRPWVDEGMVEDGWVFAAAGLSVPEARDVRDAQAWDAVFVLAGLRGVPLPLGAIALTAPDRLGS
jgi:hypothetical protein